MKGARFAAFWFLTIPMMIFFTLLSLSVPKHHELLFSTYDFIVVAKSSRVAAFVMFNVMIITVFIGCPKPSDHHQDAGCQLTSPESEYETDTNDEENDDSYSDGSDIDEYHGYDGYDEDNDDDLDTEDEDSDEEDVRDNDLETRIEEFIAKVNEKWREELLTERLLCITASYN